VVTREPTPGPVGTLLRQALTGELSDGVGRPVERLDFRCMALLFAADRCDHNERLLRPTLARHNVVISDRYTLSSLLYQSLTAPVGEVWMDWLREINRTAITPDLTVVLDVSAEVAKDRRRARGGKDELYEVDELQRDLAEAYLQAEKFVEGEHVEHIDGSQSQDAVQAELLLRVLGLLAQLD
jgi:dTMP kinase